MRPRQRGPLCTGSTSRLRDPQKQGAPRLMCWMEAPHTLHCRCSHAHSHSESEHQGEAAHLPFGWGRGISYSPPLQILPQGGQKPLPWHTEPLLVPSPPLLRQDPPTLASWASPSPPRHSGWRAACGGPQCGGHTFSCPS